MSISIKSSIFLASAALFGSYSFLAVAQSQLPDCLLSKVKHDCFGSETMSDGRIYVGEFKNNKPNGLGTWILPNEAKWIGEFRDGLPHGYGTATHSSGYVFIGQMKEGLPNGQGTMTLPNGSKIAGEFNKGISVGKFTVNYPNGTKYIGNLNGSEPDGEGILYSLRGSVDKQGRWKDGALVESFALDQRLFPFHSPVQNGTSRIAPQTVPRQVELSRSSLNLVATATSPDSSGVVTLNITTNSDTASLKINGDEAGGRADGRYSVNRFAKLGSNSFEVIATDRFGNSSKQTVVVNREIQVVAEKTRSLDPTLITAAKPRDAVAIIIGIEKYKRVSDADFANNDASAFYDYARRALGIKPENIRLLVDDKADAGEILRAFKTWLPTRVNKNTTDVYVFYSGHGLPSEDGGSLYFLPHEVDRDLLDRTAITQKEVAQAIQRTTPKSVTMFIDSCYSGQSRTGTSLLASARPISIAPKASTDFPPNFMVISASAPDQISSSSPELKHGIFSYYLMLGMEGEADVNKDGQITVGEMQTYLSQQVTRRASGMNRTQSPQTTGDLSRVLVQASSKTR
jgi:hypothetical protein